MQGDLFAEPRHDAGGKSRSRLLPGVRGDAIFAGPNDCYRPTLRRWIGETFPDAFVLSVGMNPSTATADFNDPTLCRDWEFTRAWGYSGLVKVNVADYRLTDPKKLSTVSLPLSSTGNHAGILDLASRAAIIFLAHGKLPVPLAGFGAALVADLRAAGRDLWCLGTNADGSPKHPLYVKGGTPLQRF